MFDSFVVRFVSPFWKKAKLSKWPKKSENGTNMDMILSFLAKSVDKHSITLVHITYPPLAIMAIISFLMQTLGLAALFGDMASQNFPWKKRMSHQIRLFTPGKRV